MDILAHGLISNAALYYRYPYSPKLRWLAVLFGLLPDLAAFTPLFLYLLVTRGFGGGPESWPETHWTYVYATEAYRYSHSLVIFPLVTGLVWVLRRRFPWPMLAWGLHILFDIPTHPDFFSTPFLFPFSDYRFHGGTSWAEPRLLAATYAVIAAWYLYWFFVLRKKSA